MMNIAKNLDEVRSHIPENVTLVAVSKTQDIETIQLAYDHGQRVFGENKVQELIVKQPALPADIKWHFIGHLQSNKVKFLASYIHLIHGVDSLKLLSEINKQALKNERIIDCLLQFHIAEEDTKFGLDWDEATEILDSNQYGEMENIRIHGIMGMATFTDDEEQLRSEFKRLLGIFHKLKEQYFKADAGFCETSMGMSDDYAIAIDEGSTMVRVGTAIFGARNYKPKL